MKACCDELAPLRDKLHVSRCVAVGAMPRGMGPRYELPGIVASMARGGASSSINRMCLSQDPESARSQRRGPWFLRAQISQSVRRNKPPPDATQQRERWHPLVSTSSTTRMLALTSTKPCALNNSKWTEGGGRSPCTACAERTTASTRSKAGTADAARPPIGISRSARDGAACSRPRRPHSPVRGRNWSP
jgi:hypothetical protein